MRDELHDTAYSPDTGQTDALDALLSELISQAPATSPCIPDTPDVETEAERAPLADTAMVEAMPVDDCSLETEPAAKTTSTHTTPPVVTAEPEPTPESAPAGEPMPARAYSMGDLMLFEQLTGYRLVAQRQLWRSVDKLGNRAVANDRLFTVLAEETFQMADRQRRNGPLPHADLTLHDLAAAMKPMRGIAAHLGERGIQAWDRLEIVVLATLDRRRAA
ncbi:hypothetical protein J2T09_000510 [Neorhizobium huautlense]|uniref:Uncharacterized protein n=1 Tax=Neorhizobium huautlense TaxID=67774 RepID=A0ABT9PMT6_9HYPH|nr:hypothetical protein [Neorhizobium huautlense]MDP9835769.1 hypothetical protein [Neorhizobium huautlense]